MTGTPGASPQARRMDRMYRLQRHIYDLTRRFYLLGRDRMLRALPVARGGAVLDLGCGTGRNLVRLSRLRPDLALFGADASEAMLETARAKTRRAGTRAALACALAEELCPARAFAPGMAPPGDRGFDAVYFSYVLSIIPEPLAALRAGWGLLGPGGTLAVVDFGDCHGLPAWFGRLLRAWLALFGVEHRPEVARELARLSSECGGELARQEHCRGYAELLLLRKPGP